MVDPHPDPFYKVNSDTEEEAACHRGSGSAGTLGAEKTECDSPISLINETFRWIDANMKDSIDFVIWTGDSARHDNDELIPRTEEQVLGLNELLVHKFVEVFGKDDFINDTDPTNDFTIPIVPTFGNNDILPHNIFAPGPNEMTRRYTSIWNKFIPEEQRHSFERGGWFYVEVIPNRLAVFSLNTMYFFASNAAVDGCADRSEPGYEQMEWLRIQLHFLRNRGMKAIMMGHVPPARTENKQSWDETCWQKYTLWMRRYRDVVVGSLYGHMNLDHFVLQDSEAIDLGILDGTESIISSRSAMDDEFTIQSSADYLTDLRALWSDLPDPPSGEDLWIASGSTMDEASDHRRENVRKSRKSKKSKDRREHKKFLEKIGGQWGERYIASFISPSVIPKYFPTLRVIHYNITGLEHDPVPLSTQIEPRTVKLEVIDGIADSGYSEAGAAEEARDTKAEHKRKRKTKKKSKKSKKKHRKTKKPDFHMPDHPSKSSPPGPAYSPQTFTWLGYTQYFANLTRINGRHTGNHSDAPDENSREDGPIRPAKKHKGKKPDDKPSHGHPQRFEFELEYDTRNETIFNLKDLTMRSLLDVATRVGAYEPGNGDHMEIEHDEQQAEDEEVEEIDNRESSNGLRPNKKKHKGGKKKHRKHKKRKAINKVWFTFVKRAYVGTLDDEELHQEFGEEMVTD